MKRFIKVAIVVLMLTAMPMKSWTQTPYRPYAEDGVELNFFGIDNIDFRAFLLYNISKDSRFVLVPEEEYGQFILTVKDENAHFLDEFENFYQNVTADFALLTKNDIFDRMDEWKNAIEPQHFLSITMDIALRNSRTDNEHCINSLPFCTTDLIQFEAACTSQQANEPGMDDGCIGNSYNPSWYHMRIHTAGQFIIHMEGHDPTTFVPRDIDFCMWGPYTEEEVSSGYACTHLTGDKIIDCCYSAQDTEDVYLGYPGGEHNHHGSSTSHGTINYHMPEVGEYYILMITNYSRDPCVISFTKAENSGPGETDCDILPGIVNNDGPYCEGETIRLTVNEQMNATYAWVGPDGWTSSVQNPIRLNCTLAMAGTYTCTTTVGTQATTASTEVEIYQQATPSFTATTVCQGEATSFEGMASGTNVGHYEWDFGDDTAPGIGQNVTHTYAEAGTYQVTLTVTAENGTCPGDTTQTVIVNAMPQPTATAQPNIVIYDGTSTLTGDSGISGGTFTYHWEPEDMVTDPDSPTTQTVPLHETTIYTLTVTNTQGGCSRTTQVAVSMEGSNLTASAYAENYVLCQNPTNTQSTTLHATPIGGTGQYSYSWTPETGLSNPSAQNPIATPPVGTTTYTCQVGDGLVTQSASVTITVNPKHETTITETECDLFFWDPEGHTIIETDHPSDNYEESGTFHRTYLNQYDCDSIVTLNLTVNHKSINNELTVDGDSPEYADNPICDSYPFYDPYIGVVPPFVKDTTNAIFSGETPEHCEYQISFSLLNLKYTPDPGNIKPELESTPYFSLPEDPSAPDTAWCAAVVTNTEFFSFQYTFLVEEPGRSLWDSCVWTISKPSWQIEQRFGADRKSSSCTVYVADHDEDFVKLTARAKNKCGEKTKTFYLKSSFLGMDEYGNASDKVNIVPNPNNGQMHINFEDMEGLTIVKVFDMTGNQMDAFETNVSPGFHSFDYTMKRSSNGIYFFVFANGNRVFTKKVVIIQ